MPGPGSAACQKPESAKRRKARETRAARAIVQQVRAACVARDGYCRLWRTPLMSDCVGPSQWAHMGEQKRFKTRGQPAAIRHTTAGTLMLCKAHHIMYDRAHTLTIEPLTERGADGVLRCCAHEISVLSVPR